LLIKLLFLFDLVEEGNSCLASRSRMVLRVEVEVKMLEGWWYLKEA
jgi:hypothetical protein